MPTYRGPAARYKRYSKRFLNNACIRISRIYLLSLARIRGEGETRVWQWTIRLYYLHYPFRLPARRSRYFLLFNFPCMHYFPHSDRSLKILRAKTSPVIPSLLPLSLSLSLFNFPSTPRKMFPLLVATRIPPVFKLGISEFKFSKF